ncbi:MOSC domain-containing protein [Candidatus Sumerlaeota bacterium]|nr:MOSC domain-containing protein [Candidatus Sumerlaeota bacterium]
MARIRSIQSGKAEILAGTDRWSGIRKLPLEGPVAIDSLGIAGDMQVDKRRHGGPFKALCVYCTAYYCDWKNDLGLEMPIGSFGENIAIDDLRDEDACVGDVYAIGNTVKVRVTGPRGPCESLSIHWKRKGFQLIAKDTRKTGFYLSVMEPGRITAGDEFHLLERPAPDWNIIAFWDAFEKYNNRDQKRMITETIPGIDPDWARRAGKEEQAGGNGVG